MSRPSVMPTSRRARTRAGTAVLAVLAATCSATLVAGPDAARAADWTAESARSIVAAPSDLTGITEQPVALMDARGRGLAAWIKGDGSGFKIQWASRPRGGTWTSGAAPLASSSNPDTSVSDLRMVVDKAGKATAMWLQTDAGGNTTDVFVAERAEEATTWSTPVSISDDGTLPMTPQLAVNDETSVAAVWTDGATQSVEGVKREVGTTWSTRPVKQVSREGTHAMNPVLAGGGSRFVAAWAVDGGVSDPDGVWTAQLSAGDNDWSKVSERQKVRSEADAAAQSVAVDGTGNVAVLWREFASNRGQIVASTRPLNEEWGPSRTLSPNGSAAEAGVLAVNDAGALLATWNQFNGNGQQVHTAWHVPATDTWTEPEALDAAVETPQDDAVPVDAVVDASGRPTVLVGTLGSSQAFRRDVQDGVEVWDTIVNAQPAAAISLGQDAEGDVAAFAWRDPSTGSDQLVERVYDATGPTATMTAPADLVTRATTYKPVWDAIDDWSTIASYTVTRRTAAWNADFPTAGTVWQNATTAKTATYTPAAGSTSCFSVSATDAAANTGAPSTPEVCTTTPVDDRTMSRSRGWSSASSSSSIVYRHTLTQTKTKGASLTLRNVRARTIALYALGGRGYGSIRISYAGKTVGTWSLSRSKTVPVTIKVRDLPTTQTGSVVVTVTTSSKYVRIDGLVADKKP